MTDSLPSESPGKPHIRLETSIEIYRQYFVFWDVNFVSFLKVGATIIKKELK